MRQRLPTLDGWRGVAILAVVSCHIRWPFPAMLPLAAYGALGVHLFFALSGFLITRRMLEEHSDTGVVDWANFYIRRFFRILPVALLYLCVIAFLGLALKVIPMDWAQLRASALLYRNYLLLPADRSWYTGHYWSLSVEEHFYLLWPCMLMLAGLRRGIWLAPLFAGVVAVWRTLDMHFGWTAFLGTVERTDYRLDGLLWGCALAFLWDRAEFRSALNRVAGTLLCLGALLALAADLYWQPPGYLVLLPILMAILPASTLGRPASLAARILDSPVLSWAGRISYSVYLWQQLFLPVFGVSAPFGFLQQFPTNVVAVFAVAAASYYLVERPTISFAHRAKRMRARTPAVQTAGSAA